MAKAWQVTLVGALAVLVFGLGPFVLFRSAYAHGKRLREIVPGRLYRSGQMTVEGFAEAVERCQLRTIINVQDDVPDPNVCMSYFNRRTIKESEMCRRLGVRYVQLSPDLVSRRLVPQKRPQAIDSFLALMDQESTYPALIHCKAGLHRTGVLSAVYRMEYQGWSPARAFREMKEHGFGPFACTAANDYVTQYVLTYRRGLRNQEALQRAKVSR
jgi:hypothetical protein